MWFDGTRRRWNCSTGIFFSLLFFIIYRADRPSLGCPSLANVHALQLEPSYVPINKGDSHSSCKSDKSDDSAEGQPQTTLFNSYHREPLGPLCAQERERRKYNWKQIYISCSNMFKWLNILETYQGHLKNVKLLLIITGLWHKFIKWQKNPVLQLIPFYFNWYILYYSTQFTDFGL